MASITDIQGALSSLIELDAKLKNTYMSVPHSPEVEMMVGLNRSYLRAFRHMYDAHRTKDMALSAWAARNLIELSIWTKYLLISAENRQRFCADFEMDMHECAKAVIEASNQAGLNVAELSGDMANHHKLAYKISLDKPKIGDNGHLQIREVARLLELESKLTGIYKMVSKLSHATALSVVSDQDEEVSAKVTWIFLEFGYGIIGEYAGELEKRNQALKP